MVIAQRWGQTAALAAAGCAILGHMFPVWLGFRGGKGVATALGVLIPLAWPVALVTAVLWMAIALLFHYSSLAALVAAVAGAALAAILADKATRAADRRYRLVNHRAAPCEYPPAAGRHGEPDLSR